MKKKNNNYQAQAEAYQSIAHSLLAILLLFCLWLLFYFWDWFRVSFLGKPSTKITAGNIATGENANIAGGKTEYSTVFLKPNQFTTNVINQGSYHIHTQSSASEVWNVRHDIGNRPIVQLTDLEGNIQYGEIQHLSEERTNQQGQTYTFYFGLTISFGTPQTGYCISTS